MNDFTTKGNRIGHWRGGWLSGEWKCILCGSIIGKNLRNEINPFAPREHAVVCKKRNVKS